MERDTTWHYEQNVRINRLASEMVRLFTSGHLAEQTLAYEAVRDQYLQAQVEQAYHDKGTPAPHHTQVG